MTRKQLYIVFMFAFSLAVSAQQKQVQTSIDKTKNKIGAQFNLVLKTTVDTTATVVFPGQKSFGKLEVIRNYVVDTVKKDSRYELVKKYGLTQFDSGKYTIPRLQILINKKPFFSDSLKVEVTNIKVDTIRQKMYDIKDIVKADEPSGNWWIYLLILLAIAGIGVLIYKLIKKNQNKKGELEIFKTPIEKATTLLQQLEKKELWQKGEIKNYYSELTDIARNYIEEAIKIPAMESTTSELIAGLRIAAVKKNMSLTKETVENLERVLMQADLVKFAKEKPLDFEIAEDRKKIEKSIVTLDDSIPEISEDEAFLNELQKQRLLKKQKTKRIVITIGTVVFLLFATIMFFIVTKGFDYVKDNIIGHPTKELLESEWVTSTYGDPGISVETPKVLTRLDIKKNMAKEVANTLNAMSSFGYGSLQGGFYMALTTMRLKQQGDFDLKSGLTQGVRSLGGQNLVFNQEDFQTKDGAQGLKGFGTMDMFNPVLKNSSKVYYEMLVFKEDGGLQQITIIYQVGDTYGEQIAKRFVNSVEFKKATP
ncbi:MAG TPA: hypothetical protein VK623_10230 [Flavobacterium sp.]|nr:hypothetical protein [Flavobacterium sp.]